MIGTSFLRLGCIFQFILGGENGLTLTFRCRELVIVIDSSDARTSVLYGLRSEVCMVGVTWVAHVALRECQVWQWSAKAGWKAESRVYCALCP